MGQASDAPRTGFDYWVSFRGQGNYFPTGGQPLNVNGKHVEQKGYITDELTDYAMNWLEHGRDASKPFFLYLSHKAVHSEAKPPARYAHQYADLPIPLPASMANTEENNRGKPMWVRNQRNSWHGADFFYHTNQKLTDYVRDYYRTLSPVDESLGRILTYLRRNKLENNTLIVFYSDNGFLFGDHGLIDKRNAYEPSVRVPMIAYAPGLLPKGAVNPARVRNLDLAPTFLDVAHVAPPAQFEGKSLLPVASGKVAPAAWSEDFVYEYYWEWTFPQTPTTFAIQHENLKYIQYQGVWDIEEIYDVKKDPDEMHNLIDDPSYLAAKMDLRHRLFAALQNRDGKHVVPYTERFSSGAVYRDRQGAGAAPFPPEWLKAPNEPGRMNGIFPDTPAKLAAEKQGKPYFPSRAPSAAKPE
jgi:arylsulfatase A-like enzyme